MPGSYSRNEALDVDDTVVVISTNYNRKEIILTNTGATVIYLFFSDNATPTVGEGCPLYPREKVGMATESNYTVWDGVISAIGSAAGGTLAILER